MRLGPDRPGIGRCAVAVSMNVLPAAANREVYALLKDGGKVSVQDREHGGQEVVRVRTIDWRNPAANDFLLVSQMSVTGTLYTRRPDLIGFVNGLPVIVIVRLISSGVLR